MSEDILSLAPPPADARLAYGADPNQFGELRLPKTINLPASGQALPIVMNIHGGYWRAKYNLVHAGHLCAALTAKGLATWNLEYRRVGNQGGGWPGTFEDIVNGYRFLRQITQRYNLDLNRVVIMGHSAGGQLALCLAAHELSVKNAVSLAGVVDLLGIGRRAAGQSLGEAAHGVSELMARSGGSRGPATARQTGSNTSGYRRPDGDWRSPGPTPSQR